VVRRCSSITRPLDTEVSLCRLGLEQRRRLRLQRYAAQSAPATVAPGGCREAGHLR
jgi:hypothetical protein